MRHTLPFLAAIVVAGCASETSNADVDVDPSIDPRGFGTPIPGPGTPIVMPNLRTAIHINVQSVDAEQGPHPVYLVQNGLNLDVPCSATSINIWGLYSNYGNLAAGPHSNGFYWNGALAPFKTFSEPGLAVGAQIIEQTSRNVQFTSPNTPYELRYRVDSPAPGQVTEWDENDNTVAIRITRQCP